MGSHCNSRKILERKQASHGAESITSPYNLLSSTLCFPSNLLHYHPLVSLWQNITSQEEAQCDQIKDW